MPVITRESYDVERRDRLPTWMNEFAENLEKQSTQSKGKADRSIYDQISSIMGTKPKFSSVEDAVNDMKERSGLTAFFKLQSQAQAQEPEKKSKKIKILEMAPQLAQTAENYIEATNGNLPIPAIVDKLRSIHRDDVTDDSSWDDEDFLRFLNNLNIKVKQKHPDQDMSFRDLGKLPIFTNEDSDPSNDDALHGLTPTVNK